VAEGAVQVAAYAEHHVLAEKAMQGDRPLTTFRALASREARVAEIADMLGLDAPVAHTMLADAQRALSHLS
jgi:DNA repair ATPase RecN